MLQKLDSNFFKKSITCNEIWISSQYPHHRQWKSSSKQTHCSLELQINGFILKANTLLTQNVLVRVGDYIEGDTNYKKVCDTSKAKSKVARSKSSKRFYKYHTCRSYRSAQPQVVAEINLMWSCLISKRFFGESKDCVTWSFINKIIISHISVRVCIIKLSTILVKKRGHLLIEAFRNTSIF